MPPDTERCLASCVSIVLQSHRASLHGELVKAEHELAVRTPSHLPLLHATLQPMAVQAG